MRLRKRKIKELLSLEVGPECDRRVANALGMYKGEGDWWFTKEGVKKLWMSYGQAPDFSENSDMILQYATLVLQRLGWSIEFCDGMTKIGLYDWADYQEIFRSKSFPLCLCMAVLYDLE